MMREVEALMAQYYSVQSGPDSPTSMAELCVALSKLLQYSAAAKQTPDPADTSNQDLAEVDCNTDPVVSIRDMYTASELSRPEPDRRKPALPSLLPG